METKIKNVAESNTVVAENAVRVYLSDGAVDIQPKDGKWSILDFISNINEAFPDLQGRELTNFSTGDAWTVPEFETSDLKDADFYHIWDKKTHKFLCDIGKTAFETLETQFPFVFWAYGKYSRNLVRFLKTSGFESTICDYTPWCKQQGFSRLAVVVYLKNGSLWIDFKDGEYQIVNIAPDTDNGNIDPETFNKFNGEIKAIKRILADFNQ